MENANVLAAAAAGAGNMGKTPEDMHEEVTSQHAQQRVIHGHWKSLTASTKRLGITNETTATLIVRQHTASAKHITVTNGLPHRTQHRGNLELLAPHLILVQRF